MLRAMSQSGSFITEQVIVLTSIYTVASQSGRDSVRVVETHCHVGGHEVAAAESSLQQVAALPTCL